jgi:hypothetical protein
MKIEHAEVYGFRASFRGLRNPLNSWEKSDSQFGPGPWCYPWNEDLLAIESPEHLVIGSKDLELACNLIKGGNEHRKFLRQIIVWFDITIPLYIWAEADTYKVATVRNSCSTMHTLGLRDLNQEDFELPVKEYELRDLNEHGERFRLAKELKDSSEMNKIRREYKNDLPSGFLQKATYMMSYETALSMYFQRRNHRLVEWSIKNPNSICSFIVSLPYMKEFIGAKE